MNIFPKDLVENSEAIPEEFFFDSSFKRIPRRISIVITGGFSEETHRNLLTNLLLEEIHEEICEGSLGEICEIIRGSI